MFDTFFSRIRTVFAMLLRWNSAEWWTQDGEWTARHSGKRILNWSNERLNHNLILLDDCFCLFKYTLDVVYVATYSATTSPWRYRYHRASIFSHENKNFSMRQSLSIFKELKKFSPEPAEKKIFFLELPSYLFIWIRTAFLPTGICLQFICVHTRACKCVWFWSNQV